MHICVYMHACICIYSCLFVYVCIRVSVCMCLHVCIYMYMHACMCVHVCMHMHVCAPPCVNVCMYVCVSVCLDVCMCVYMCAFLYVSILSSYNIIASYMFWQDQCTPLYIASYKGFMDIVNSLIAANANPNCICKVSCKCKYLLAFSTEDKLLYRISILHFLLLQREASLTL